jgi:hypothetical protein
VPVDVDVPADTPPGDYEVTLRVGDVVSKVREVTSTLTVRQKPAAPAPPQQQQTQQPAPPTVVAPRPVVRSQGLTVAQLRAALRRLRFSSTRRSAVLRNGLSFVQEFPAAGQATWSLTRGAVATAAQSRPLARLSRRITRAGRQSVRLRLTKAGKRALRRSRRRVSLRLTTTFVDAQRRRVVVPVTVRLR